MFQMETFVKNRLNDYDMTINRKFVKEIEIF